MNISIQPAIFELSPEAQLGLVFVQHVNNRADLSAWAAEQKAMEDNVKVRFPTPESVGLHPFIHAWRRMYKAFGTDPQKYKCSSEGLTRQVLKGGVCG